MRKSPKRKLYEQRIHRVQDYICAHIDEEHSLETLAGLSAFSPFHFHRIFSSVSGETLFGFIQRLRLEKACALLAGESDRRVIDIALDCGFATPSSFAKAFKQRYGQSPSDFRKRNPGTLMRNDGTDNSNSGKEFGKEPCYSPFSDIESLYKRRNAMNVKIEQIADRRIAYMRHIGAYGTGNIQVMEKLKLWAAARELMNDSAEILGIAHDNPEITPPDKCRYDACIVIPDNFKVDDSVNTLRLEGGKYAVYPVEHTAEGVTKGWRDMFTVWLPDSGCQIDGRPMFERYRPKAGNISDIECALCIPLKPI